MCNFVLLFNVIIYIIMLRINYVTTHGRFFELTELTKILISGWFLECNFMDSHMDRIIYYCRSCFSGELLTEKTLMVDHSFQDYLHKNDS